MGRSKTNSTRGRTARQSSELPAGKTWDEKSGPDQYDGRANTNALGGSEGIEGGKWNRKPRKAVVISRNIVREV